MCPTVLGVCVNERKDDSPGILFIYGVTNWFHFQYLKEQLLNLICYVYCIWLYKTDDANGNSVHKNESVAIFFILFFISKNCSSRKLTGHRSQIAKMAASSWPTNCQSTSGRSIKCTILFCRYSKVHTLLNYSNMFSLQVNNKHNNK